MTRSTRAEPRSSGSPSPCTSTRTAARRAPPRRSGSASWCGRSCSPRPGERPHRPDFGSGVLQLLFEPATTEVAATVQFVVQGALQQWLGHLVEIDGVEVRAEEAPSSSPSPGPDAGPDAAGARRTRRELRRDLPLRLGRPTPGRARRGRGPQRYRPPGGRRRQRRGHPAHPARHPRPSTCRQPAGRGQWRLEGGQLAARGSPSSPSRPPRTPASCASPATDRRPVLVHPAARGRRRGRPRPPEGWDPALAEVRSPSARAVAPTSTVARRRRRARAPRRTAVDYTAKDYDGFRRVALDRMAVLQPGWEQAEVADVRTMSSRRWRPRPTGCPPPGRPRHRGPVGPGPAADSMRRLAASSTTRCTTAARPGRSCGSPCPQTSTARPADATRHRCRRRDAGARRARTRPGRRAGARGARLRGRRVPLPVARRPLRTDPLPYLERHRVPPSRGAVRATLSGAASGAAPRGARAARRDRAGRATRRTARGPNTAAGGPGHGGARDD